MYVFHFFFIACHFSFKDPTIQKSAASGYHCYYHWLQKIPGEIGDNDKVNYFAIDESVVLAIGVELEKTYLDVTNPDNVLPYINHN